MSRRKLNEEQKHRLRAIRSAAKIGVATAARKAGMSQVSLYKWINRFKQEGENGLIDRSHKPKSHPESKSKETVDQIVDKALQYPTMGCTRLAALLSRQGVTVSSPTVQKNLIERGLGRIEDRVGKVEQLLLAGDIQQSLRLVAEIESADPAFSERDNIGKQPGDLLVADILRSGIMADDQRLFLAVVVDAVSNYVWVYPHTRDDPLPHCEILHQQVLQDLANWNIRARIVMTPDKWSWTGESHAARSFGFWCREVWRLIHRAEPAQERNGFIEGIQLELKAWFRRESLNCTTLEEIEGKLNEWLERRNTESRMTYPCFGRSPREMIGSKSDR